jgi:hypothetical protein
MGGVDVYTHVFLTSALVVSERSAHTPVALLPGKKPNVLIGYEAGWATEPA